MENKPKKSKAFIITFILVLIILLVGYFLLKNKDGIFRINNTENSNKTFESLSETKEAKDLGYINVNTANECLSISVIAGEDILRGEAVYISRLGANGEPIAKKAIASDNTKSKVVGVAMANILSGTMGTIANDCIVTGINTERNEGTVWKIGDTLYLSDTVPGALTKNPPSNKIIVGTVKTVSAVDGSIKVGGAGTNIFDLSQAIKDSGIDTSKGISYAINKLKQLFGNIFGYEYNSGDFNINGFGEWIFDEEYGGFVWKWKGTNPDFNGPDFPDFGSIRACNNERDDDGDGLIDKDDPQCHIEGILTNEYIPNHYSESVNAIDPNGPNDDLFACNNGGDDDGDGLTDEKDPQCHVNGDLTKQYIPTHYSEEINAVNPNESYACSNTFDDDKDGLVDRNDPQCHINGDLTKEYVPTHYSESVNAPNPDVIPTPNDVCDNGTVNYPLCTIGTNGSCKNGATNPPTCTNFGNETNTNPDDENTEINKCAIFDEYPLEFTDNEKAQLAELLREFYLIAPTLKTEDDIDSLYAEINRYENLIAQADELTNRCYVETSVASGYTGPTRRFGNPWFKSINIGSYVDETKYSTQKINTDSNYVMKSHGTEDTLFGGPKCEDYDNHTNKCLFYKNGINIYTPLITKNPTAQSGRVDNRNWEFLLPFDENKVMLERLKEFELLLYIW